MLALILITALAATEATPPDDAPAELRVNLPVDLAVTAALGAGWLGSEAAFKRTLAPAECRWCDSNAIDDWGRGLRGAPDSLLTWDLVSGVVDFGALPLAAFGMLALAASDTGLLRTFPIDALLVLEAMVAAQCFNQVVKFIVGRERPFVHALDPADKALTRDPADNNLSFFSGHSTFAFAVVVGAGTVARLRGYKRAWLVWALGLPIAASVPLLRMAADRHYLTDVLTGSLVGAAFGAGIPLLFHGRLAVVPMPGGAGVAGTF